MEVTRQGSELTSAFLDARMLLKLISFLIIRHVKEIVYNLELPSGLRCATLNWSIDLQSYAVSMHHNGNACSKTSSLHIFLPSIGKDNKTRSAIFYKTTYNDCNWPLVPGK